MVSLGVVGWCEGVMYLMSPGRPADTGLQLGKACYPCSGVRVGRWCFYFFCFFTFIPVPLSSLSLSFISSAISSVSFLPFSGRRHKMTHKGWRVIKPQHNQSINVVSLYILQTFCQNASHCENTPIEIYRKFHLKNWKFLDKKLWYFSYFCSKHRLLVLVRTASPRRF